MVKGAKEPAQLIKCSKDMSYNALTTLGDHFDYWVRRWEKADPYNREDNDTRMKKAWHPHQDTMDDLLAQIQDGQRFATYIFTPNTDPQLIAIAEKLILDTQQFKAEYKAWKRLPET